MPCELLLRITPGDSKCLAYQQSGSDTCRYCNEVDMSGERKNCRVEGCTKYSQSGKDGMCKAHYAEAQKAALPTGVVIKPAVEYPELDQDVASVKESFGKVANADGGSVSFGVDLMVHMAMRDAWYEVERKALEALSGLSPASALIRAASFVQQIQRLEVQP